jgi:N-acetyl sugar amidotransferase
MFDNHPQVCSRCVSDSTIPGIHFDERHVCQFCHVHDEMEKQYPKGEAGRQRLEQLIAKIKREGRRRNYDCIVGVSGGRDSTYLLYVAVQLGLRPLAVHFDNGWNSEIAVRNIKNALSKLNVDLYTIVADWEEFKDLQIAFLRASVSDAEVPTDVAIFGSLHRVAAEEGVRYILNGHSFRTEGIMPIGWTYMDGRYIDSVHRLFGQKKRRNTVPNFTYLDLIYYNLLKRIKVIPLLNYVDYSHEQADEILKENLDWIYYGGHHHESHFTHFFQSFLLPQKFNIDKRKIEYSALIRSGARRRADALSELQEVPYPCDEALIAYTIKKLGLSSEEFAEIMKTKPKSFHDYPTYYPMIQKLRLFVRIACTFGLLPKLLAYKYLG